MINYVKNGNLFLKQTRKYLRKVGLGGNGGRDGQSVVRNRVLPCRKTTKSFPVKYSKGKPTNQPGVKFSRKGCLLSIGTFEQTKKARWNFDSFLIDTFFGLFDDAQETGFFFDFLHNKIELVMIIRTFSRAIIKLK